MTNEAKHSMDAFKDNMARFFFGHSLDVSKEISKCVMCSGDASEFKDVLSAKEYAISGMCQACQDKTFDEDDV